MYWLACTTDKQLRNEMFYDLQTVPFPLEDYIAHIVIN
jgi:hypothetical protein